MLVDRLHQHPPRPGQGHVVIHVAAAEHVGDVIGDAVRPHPEFDVTPEHALHGVVGLERPLVVQPLQVVGALEAHDHRDLAGCVCRVYVRHRTRERHAVGIAVDEPQDLAEALQASNALVHHVHPTRLEQVDESFERRGGIEPVDNQCIRAGVHARHRAGCHRQCGERRCPAEQLSAIDSVFVHFSNSCSIRIWTQTRCLIPNQASVPTPCSMATASSRLVLRVRAESFEWDVPGTRRHGAGSPGQGRFPTVISANSHSASTGTCVTLRKHEHPRGSACRTRSATTRTSRT